MTTRDTSKTSMLGSVIGMPLTALTQIPNLVRGGRERKQAEAMREGKGFGAKSARMHADQAARNATSIAAGGAGPSKAFAARTAMRAARDERQTGAMAAAGIAAQESLAGTQMLRDQDIARRAAIGQLGAAAGGALASFDAQRMAAEDRTFQAEQKQKEMDFYRDMAGIQNGTQAEPETPGGVEGMLAAAEQGHQEAQPTIQQGQEDLDYLAAIRDPKVTLAMAGGISLQEAVEQFYPGMGERVAAMKERQQG